MKIKAGNKFEMAWPFYKEDIGVTCNQDPFSNNPPPDEVKQFDFWTGGCYRLDESVSEYSHDYHYIATAEGKVIFEVISIAKMPNRYQDRVLYKRTRIDPDGYELKESEVRVMTINAFKKTVNSHTPFRADYEIEEDFVRKSNWR